MKDKIIWSLVLAAVVYAALAGYLDVPAERARTALWVSANMTSAGTHGGVFKEWLEGRGYEVREIDAGIVSARVGADKLHATKADHYWTSTVKIVRPLGEMDLVLYVAENQKDNYLDYWATATVEGKR